jgi:two-component system sensor histidine kinase CreC
MRTTQIALLAVVIIVSLGFGLLTDTLMRDIESENFQATEEVLVDMANVLASVVETGVKNHQLDASVLRDAFPHALERQFDAAIFDLHKTKVNTQVYLTDAKGVVLYDSDGGKLEGTNLAGFLDVRRTLEGVYGARSTRSNKNDSSTSVLHIAAPVRDGDHIIGVLCVRKPKLDQWFFVQQRQTKIKISTLLIGAGIALFIGAVIFWVLRPLRELTAYVQAIQRGERAPAPVLKASSDVSKLASAVEDMRDELEGRDYAATFVQTLTHELKSPLAAIRATSELLAENNMDDAQRERFAQNLRSESERAEHLIRQLLRLAEVERQKSLKVRTGADLAAITSQAMSELASMAVAKDVRLDLQLPESGSAIIQGDETLLRRAVMNLIENAIDFAPAGSAITIRLHRDEQQQVLTIADRGPGVPDYALPRLFERFYSLKHKETGRKGSGLGLCFAKEAAELHGGTITLSNREGGGAEARMALPVA